MRAWCGSITGPRSKRAGFQVDEALNGLEALEKLLTIPVDLLIVDVNMPQMDGLTFLQAVRQKDRALASIPALVTSTESAEADFEAARAAGANFYLVKPIDQPRAAGIRGPAVRCAAMNEFISSS